MPYGRGQETSLPITFHLTGEDAITRNGYWRREFALYYLDEDGDEVLWALEGEVSGAYATVKPTLDDPYVLFMHTSNGQVILGEEADGYSFALELQHTDTNSIDDWGMGVWDIYVIQSGRQIYLYRGNAALSRNVT